MGIGPQAPLSAGPSSGWAMIDKGTLTRWGRGTTSTRKRGPRRGRVHRHRPPRPQTTTAASSGRSPGTQLFFYTLGDVLGSGIYVLIGLVAAAVGGAFWIAFAVGVTVAAITGAAYAELVTKYPQAAGASLYVNKAFGNRPLTFLVTVSFLAASFAAVRLAGDRLLVVLRRALGAARRRCWSRSSSSPCWWSSTSSASPSRW